MKRILITALNTGMRRVEILSLKGENVDFPNNAFIIESYGYLFIRINLL
jgi:integrase